MYNRETECPSLKTGDKAYYEAYGIGALSCRVIKVKGRSGLPALQKVTVRLTIRRARGKYHPKDIVETYGQRVFPRSTLIGKDRDMIYKIIATEDFPHTAKNI